MVQLIYQRCQLLLSFRSYILYASCVFAISHFLSFSIETKLSWKWIGLLYVATNYTFATAVAPDAVARRRRSTGRRAGGRHDVSGRRGREVRPRRTLWTAIRAAATVRSVSKDRVHDLWSLGFFASTNGPFLIHWMGLLLVFGYVDVGWKCSVWLKLENQSQISVQMFERVVILLFYLLSQISFQKSFLDFSIWQLRRQKVHRHCSLKCRLVFFHRNCRFIVKKILVSCNKIT